MLLLSILSGPAEAAVAAALCLTGFLAGWLTGRIRTAHFKARLQASEAFFEQETARLRQSAQDDAEAEARHAQELLAMREKQYEALLDEQRRHQQELQDEMAQFRQTSTEALKAQFDLTVSRATDQLQQLTDHMLKERQQAFLETSGTALSQLVTPLKETMENMKAALSSNTLQHSTTSSELKTVLEQLMQQSEAARKSADSLAEAFRHSNQIQGDWGETVLDELLASQGLQYGIHYDTQPVMRPVPGKDRETADAQRLRPDLVLHLDSTREIIIDAKTSLSAYMDYVHAGSEADRQTALKAHIESLRRHVRELAAKDYSNWVVPPKVSVGYVIMFVPNSAALWTALNAEPALWRRAMEQKVFMADEQTLFAALNIVRLTWTRIEQTQSHQRVYQLAEEMVERVGMFVDCYNRVGLAMETARKAWEEGRKKLLPGGRSIVQTAQKLTALGARASTRHPLPGSEDEQVPAAWNASRTVCSAEDGAEAPATSAEA